MEHMMGHHYERRNSSDDGHEQYRSSKRSRPNRPCLLVYNQGSSPTTEEEDDPPQNHPHHHHHQQQQHQPPPSRHVSLATVPVTAHMIHAGHSGSHVSSSDGGQYQIIDGKPVPLTYRVVPVSDLSPSTAQHSSSSETERSPEPTVTHHHHHPVHHHTASNLVAQQLALASGSAQALLAAGGTFHAGPGSAAGIAVATPSGSDGPYFVMMTPSSGIEGGRKKSPSNFSPTDLSMSSSMNRTGVNRDDKRRATHNEVERRRRDKINNWITRLAKLVPDCDHDHSKSGQSKGGILAKACDHISSLERRISDLTEAVKDRTALLQEVSSLREQLMEAQSENRRLESRLKTQEESGIQVNMNDRERHGYHEANRM